MLGIEGERLEKEIEDYTRKNISMAEGFDKGKRLAAGVLVKRMQMPIAKMIRKWKVETQKNTLGQLEATLVEKVNAFKKLQGIRERLENKNKTLLLEGEDLRQASMDGLEIANV